VNFGARGWLVHTADRRGRLVDIDRVAGELMRHSGFTVRAAAVKF
jgi:hypothetical protein